MDTSIYDKVKAILDRANHPNTPKAEADTALALAQKLIIKHGLDESALAESNGEVEDIVRDVIEFRGKWALQRLFVASTIAKANSVATYRSESGRDKNKCRYLYMFGTKADIFATKTLVASAELLATRSLPQRVDRSYLFSWWRGFNYGMSTVLRSAKSDVIKESGADGSRVSLVLADKFKRADSEMRANVQLRTIYNRSATSDRSGYNAGTTAGRAFSVGSTRIGGSAIGALSR